MASDGVHQHQPIDICPSVSLSHSLSRSYSLCSIASDLCKSKPNKKKKKHAGSARRNRARRWCCLFLAVIFPAPRERVGRVHTVAASGLLHAHLLRYTHRDNQADTVSEASCDRMHRSRACTSPAAKFQLFVPLLFTQYTQFVRACVPAAVVLVGLHISPNRVCVCMCFCVSKDRGEGIKVSFIILTSSRFRSPWPRGWA